LRSGEVLLEGQVGLVEFEEARRGDPFVPPASKKKEQKKQRAKVSRGRAGVHARARSGDARLLPAFVVHEVMRPDGVEFCVRFVPDLAFEDFRLVDEGPVIAKHALVDREGWC